LDQTNGAMRVTEEAGRTSPALIEDFLIELHERVHGFDGPSQPRHRLHETEHRDGSNAKTGEKRRRVASLGPGLTVGEMALFDGCARSADLVADEKVICYGLAVEQLKELAVTHPNFMLTILSNLTRDERLRHANEAIRSLE
jgi:Cyclic nucleotide-binding domain